MRFITLLGAVLLPLGAAAQPLSLRDAVKLALDKHPSLQAAAARTKAAGSRVDQTRGAYHPKLGYTEFVQGSNNPVFAFGTLLNQRRFSQTDFDVNRLNSPGFIANFQSQAFAEQLIYDFGAARQQTRTAEIGRKMSQEEETLQSMRQVAAVARAYYSVQLTREALTVAQSAVKSAEADLERAEAVRTAGMSTDADVLSIRVHLAATRQQMIARQYDLDVARAALNDTLGIPLDTDHQLTTPLTVAKTTSETVTQRPEQRQAILQTELAESQRRSARLSLYPQIVARGVFEANRHKFVTDGGANWWLGAGLRWNFDTGGSASRRSEEAAHLAVAAQAAKRQVDSAVELHVRQARSAWKSATERLAVADAAIAQAEESLRIIKNRFEAGLTTVNELLRNETALLEARTRRLAAVYDQRLAAVEVELASGRLSGDNDVLN
jgi:outer membrane protein TolC